MIGSNRTLRKYTRTRARRKVTKVSLGWWQRHLSSDKIFLLIFEFLCIKALITIRIDVFKVYINFLCCHLKGDVCHLRSDNCHLPSDKNLMLSLGRWQLSLRRWQFYFFAKKHLPRVKLCEESIARIFEAWKNFPDPLNHLWCKKIAHWGAF